MFTVNQLSLHVRIAAAGEVDQASGARLQLPTVPACCPCEVIACRKVTHEAQAVVHPRDGAESLAGDGVQSSVAGLAPRDVDPSGAARKRDYVKDEHKQHHSKLRFLEVSKAPDPVNLPIVHAKHAQETEEQACRTCCSLYPPNPRAVAAALHPDVPRAQHIDAVKGVEEVSQGNERNSGA
eukprot:CAMPEP_0171110464 /NCGR_PEP_ID=MMETSP0766_2-20121228/71365_1 /TAXON_ID=439317 /ORGANISM="Gambierdiscus australes, Strain CAWD 149" /LENGTH=180 /DNA_ID=CAMNT_0011572333 /DNA_START=34 /DNA_END=576 /DNA_ORIENTATION=-